MPSLKEISGVSPGPETCGAVICSPADFTSGLPRGFLMPVGSIHLISALNNSASSIGLETKSFIPEVLMRSRVSCITSAVSATIFMFSSFRSPRMNPVASMPSISGICTSISIRSISFSLWYISTQRFPSGAMRTSNPWFSSISRIICWLISLSSATSIFAPRIKSKFCG
ncbi:MAG: hypothetical protein ACD_47C00067G0001 [uncultured bacterium]|nr:MAG: hypothetical protein ACD_47C00067G0001 [uncultured bacterium]